MGYETNMVICTKGCVNNYLQIEASLEMGKVAYGEVGDLVYELRDENEKREKKSGISELRKEVEKAHKKIFNQDGNYTPEVEALPKTEQDKMYDKLRKKEKKLEKLTPHMYYTNRNKADYADCYGDLLLTTDIASIKKAIIKDQATGIAKGAYGKKGYRRFAIAIALLESFEKNFDQDVVVVLYGH